MIKKERGNYPYNFIAYYKNFIDNNWYSYNNEKIELIKDYKYKIIDGKNTQIIIYAGTK